MSVLIVGVVMNGLVGWKNLELSFSKVKLKLVVLHPHRHVQETEWLRVHLGELTAGGHLHNSGPRGRVYVREEAPAPILGGPQWGTGVRPTVNLAMTP